MQLNIEKLMLPVLSLVLSYAFGSFGLKTVHYNLDGCQWFSKFPFQRIARFVFLLIPQEHHRCNSYVFSLACHVSLYLQVGTVLDTVEQLVEEQSLDLLKSDKYVPSCYGITITLCIYLRLQLGNY